MRTDTLYISDLDGTLLGTDSRISPRSSEIISDLSREGAMITVATARTPATVVPLLAGTVTTPPAIVMTGTAMWSRPEGRFFDAHFLPRLEVEEALAICHSHAVHPFVYVMADDGFSLDVYHGAPTLNKAEESFYLERCGLKLKRFHLGTPPPARAFTHGMLFYAMGQDRAVADAAEAIRAGSDCSVCSYPDIFNPGIYNLEIFPPGVTKASAVRRLKEHMGVKRLVVFGDNLNDLPMLAEADVAVAVGNALPEVKQAATTVIEPNCTDSVARFIETD